MTTQDKILRYLQAGPATVCALGDHLKTDPTAIGILLERMKGDGLVVDRKLERADLVVFELPRHQITTSNH